MRAVVIYVLSFVASTLGYMITFPNGDEGTGWTTAGPQTVNWTTVTTDPPTFMLNLTNQQISGFVPQILINQVNGSAGSIQVTSPFGGFIAGSAYRIDFVTSPDNLNDAGGILAQSNQFNITGPDSSGSSANSTSTQTAINYGSTGTDTATDLGGGSATDTSLLPTSSNSGATSSRYPIQTSLLVVFSLLGFTLA